MCVLSHRCAVGCTRNYEESKSGSIPNGPRARSLIREGQFRAVIDADRYDDDLMKHVLRSFAPETRVSDEEDEMDPFEYLHELHARLIRAQRSENDALRKLSAATTKRPANMADYKAVLAAAQAAGRRANEIYEEWNRHVESLHGDRHGAGRPDRDGQPRPIDAEGHRATVENGD
jgi:hypothetical protein